MDNSLKSTTADMDREIGQRVRDALSYDPLSGLFSWSRTVHSRALKGMAAGTKNGFGYIVIQFEKKTYRGHRLAWFFTTGSWPVGSIDHLDGDKSNNRFENLRDTDHATNMKNQTKPHKGNVSGFLGVSFHKSTGKWAVQIVKKGLKRRHYGLFSTPEEASQVYLALKSKLHAEAVVDLETKLSQIKKIAA